MHVDGDCCLSMAMRLSGSVRSAAIVIDGIEQTVPTWGPESWEEEKTQFLDTYEAENWGYPIGAVGMFFSVLERLYIKMVRYLCR